MNNPFLQHIDSDRIELKNQFESLKINLLSAYEGHSKTSSLNTLYFAPCPNTNMGLSISIDYRNMKIRIYCSNLHLNSRQRDDKTGREAELQNTEKLFINEVKTYIKECGATGDSMSIEFSFSKITSEVIEDIAKLMELRDFKPRQTETYNYAL